MIFFILYTNFFVNFFISLFLICYTKSFVLKNTLSPTLCPTVSSLFLFTYFIISSYDFFNTTFTSSCISFISFTNFSTLVFFSFLLISKSILNSHLYSTLDSDNFITICILLLKANSVVTNHSG